MKGINKILLLFLVILVTIFVIFWETLQTKWVGSYISKAFTKIVQQSLNADIKFENLQFNFYPPGAELRNVQFEMKRKDLLASSKFNKVGVYFNPLDLFNTSFHVDQVVFEDGEFNLNGEKIFKKTKGAGKKNKLVKIDYSFLEKIPVKTVRFVRADIHLSDYLISTDYLTITNLQESILAEGSLYSPDLYRFIGLKLHSEIDSLSFELKVRPNRIDITSFKVNSDLSSVTGSGTVLNYFSDKLSYKIKSNIEMPIRQIHKFIDLDEIGEISGGDALIEVNARGKGQNIHVDLSAKIKNVQTSFVTADDVAIKAKVDNNTIVMEKFSLRDGLGNFVLSSPFELYNFKRKTYVNGVVEASINNMKSEVFLYYLKEKVDPLFDLNLTGDAEFYLRHRNDYEFIIKEDSVITDFRLKSSNDNLLTLKKASIKKSSFHIKNGDVKILLGLKTKKTKFLIDGHIGKDELKLQVKNGLVDLSEMSPIAGLNLKGHGLLELNLLQKGEDSMSMEVLSDLKDFSLDGYLLDTIQSTMKFNLDEEIVDILGIKATSNKSKITSNLKVNYNTLGVDGKFSIENLNLRESKKILNPILHDFEMTQEELNGSWQMSGDVRGRVLPEDVIISGKMKSKNLYLYNEILETLSLDYLLKDNEILVTDILSTKAKGKIWGEANYKISDDVMTYNFEASDLPLNEVSYYKQLPLKLRAKISGNFKGVKKGEDNFYRADFDLTNTYVDNDKYLNSYIKFHKKTESTSVDISLFGKKLHLDGTVNFLDKSEVDSDLNLNVNIPKLSKFISIFSGTSLSSLDLSGKIIYDMNARFNLSEQYLSEIESNMKVFELNKDPIKVIYSDSEPEIKVRKGKIEKWDMNVRGKKFYIISDGKGSFNKDYDVKTKLRLDASLLEIFNDYISKANGSLRAKVHNFKNEKIDDYTAFITSSNLSLDTNLLPTGITKGDMRLSLKDKKLLIDKFLAQLVNGSLALSGDVDLSRVIPELDVRYVFKDAGISVMNKSNLIFSGKGSIVGSTYPYTVGGDLYIQKFVLINDVTDFAGGEEDFFRKEIDYLPGNSSKSLDEIVNFNLNVSTREPIYIKNTIADIGFSGSVQVTGGEKDPRLDGKLALAPRLNRINFKNNEFLLSKGNIFFSEVRAYDNPELDFLATSSINDYRVSVKALGPVESFDMSLTSEPNLSQGDVLSLIAFGYTEDISQELSDAERESMTRAGVGSILFDSFKINETLKNEFGLQVNLGTEISEEQGSFLAQRNDGQSTIGRVRSATTFEIKKQISEDINLAVSSTIGSNSNQRQKMNINYNVDDKTSLEGVYENRTDDDTEELINDTSIGADIRWKWSFK